jgi:hypothetical protein
MKALHASTIAALLLTARFLQAAEEAPELALPTPQHQWLQQLVGEWKAEVEVQMDPAQPPMKYEASESVKALGGFWTISEVSGTFDTAPYAGRMTLGYDPEKEKYVGTYVDSFTSMLWVYEGSVDESGKVLTLETEGPCELQGGRIAKFKEVIEILNPDERKFTSSVQDAEGNWTTMMTIRYQRKD